MKVAYTCGPSPHRLGLWPYSPTLAPQPYPNPAPDPQIQARPANECGVVAVCLHPYGVVWARARGSQGSRLK